LRDKLAYFPKTAAARRRERMMQASAGIKRFIEFDCFGGSRQNSLALEMREGDSTQNSFIKNLATEN